jgi:hypothetical protein
MVQVIEELIQIAKDIRATNRHSVAVWELGHYAPLRT